MKLSALSVLCFLAASLSNLLPSLVTAQTDADVPVAPAPWLLDVAEGYVFVLPTILSSAFLPPGTADPLEKDAETSTGAMVPDIGALMLVRYSSSPVGPYDELIYIPGRWAYSSGRSGLRITRIYVSSNASVYNGRRNWNIPKHLATFDWKNEDDGITTTVSVSSAESDNATPFFSVQLSPVTGPIPIEVNTTLTGPYLTLIQPPLPALPNDPIVVGTGETNTKWKSFLFTAKTETASPVGVVGNLAGRRIGDGVGYPDIFPLLPVGVNITGILNFPIAETLDSV
ncbi:hypothetical protein E1B28_013613 [Marasmius oreades]|uniref:Uncharacterized protein n=1 Tax=Marasmius oreades TaxID=181124 RepID=A0A9P7UN71_9AGAR|nr:uncharacterized protein E1B28_013613 [Marasmius oreades]KAG7087665.1 hypothetical protein E1B28_013613 [Marasmius oreades]